MSIDACGYGRRLAPGEPDPELPPAPGSVYGRVSRYDIDRIREFKSLEAIPSVRIALNLPAGVVTTASDQWGRFQFANVPPGKYQLSVDAGQGLTPWMPEPVVLADGEACVDTEIVLQPSGKVSGRVLTADGRPGAGIYVRLLPDGPAGSLLAQMVDRGHTTGPMAASPSRAWALTATCWPSTRKAVMRPAGSRTPPPFSAGRIARPRRGFPSGRDRRSSWIARSCCRRLWPRARSRSP